MRPLLLQIIFISFLFQSSFAQSIKSIENFLWKNNQWEPSSKEIYQNNKLGNPLLVVKKTYSSSTNTWGNLSRHLYKYNAQKLKSREEFQRWDFTQKKWIEKASIWEYNYDSKGREISFLTWGVNNNNIYYDKYVRYKYQNDLLEESESKKWNYNLNKWEKNFLSRHKYDGNRLRSKTLTMRWNKNTSGYFNSTVTLFEYSNGKQLKKRQTKDISSPKSFILAEERFTYDSKGRLKDVERYSHNFILKKLVPLSKEIYSYNSDGYIDVVIHQSPNKTTGNWNNGLKKVYTYTFGVGIQENKVVRLNVYPNPAVNTIQIEGIGNEEKIEIVDLTGKSIIKTVKNSEVDISELPKGIYFLKHKKGNTMGQAQFVKI